jgi:hypothetical protein
MVRMQITTLSTLLPSYLCLSRALLVASVVASGE